MIPASFDESNCVLNPPDGMSLDDCDCLSVWRGQTKDGMPVVISCWKMTKDEMEEFQKTGRVWLWSFGESMPPSALGVKNPWSEGDDSSQD